MGENLGSYRKSYEKNALTEANAAEDPLLQFETWFREAEEDPAIEEANAMTLATVGPDGYPKARVVLLKGYDRHGFNFYTNYESEKGLAITTEPRVCLSFFWPALERQVIIQGKAEKLPASDSDAYFRSRPRGSRLGAIASQQSREVPSREALEQALAALESEYEGKEIPRPKHWGGYRVIPGRIEFWQGRPNRLHDRLLYILQEDGSYVRKRLAP